MKQKQVRVSDRRQIKTILASFVGKKITLVLLNQTSFLVTLTKMDDQRLIARNMRNKTVEYPLDQVCEIYHDIDA